jgi:hypothetical protein
VPDDFEVGPTGLPLYRYSDWRALIVQRWQAAYGPDADTRPETPDGLIVDTLTLLMTLQGDATQGVYAGSFFRTAASAQLDQLLDLFGRLRLAATSTTVETVWYGDTGAEVWSGTGDAPVVAVSSAGPTDGDRYAVTEAGVIESPEDATTVVYEILEVVDGEDYGVRFDGLDQLATATGTDPEDLAIAVETEINSTWPAYTTTLVPGTVVGRWMIAISGVTAGTVCEIADASDNPDNAAMWGTVVLSAEAEETGAQQCLALSLTEPVAALPSGVEGVFNLSDGTLGREVETDAAYRARHVDQINVGGKGTPQSIRAAVLAELPDPLVEYCRVDENIGPTTVEGRPGHSFELTWIGTATAQQVAEVVFTQKPAGIRAWGDTEVEVLDELGDGHRVGVSEGETLYLHLDITVTPGEGWPETGDLEDAITEAVVTDLEARLGLGTNLYRVQVVGAVVAALDGVGAVVVLTDTTSTDPGAPAVSAADVVTASNQILRVDSTRITVTIV